MNGKQKWRSLETKVFWSRNSNSPTSKRKCLSRVSPPALRMSVSKPMWGDFLFLQQGETRTAAARYLQRIYRTRSPLTPWSSGIWHRHGLLHGTHHASSSRTTTVPPPNSDDLRWFTEEVQPHEKILRGYLHSSFPALRDVDDVVQESLLRIWRARLRTPINSAKAFLFQVARHLAIDELRTARRQPTESLRDFSLQSVLCHDSDAAEALSRAEKVEVVAGVLIHLPARCREIFILRKLQQVSQREIAARLGISERTVESQITRGMKLCEAHLRRKGIHSFTCNERSQPSNPSGAAAPRFPASR